MQIHKLIQGSPEWLEHRTKFFNASDAPVMMGVSPYKTRSQLLNEMATGIYQDVDQSTQRRYDDGHRYEALARPLAEDIIGDDLYPISGSAGKYAASFDGVTVSGRTIFEHKTINDDIRVARTVDDLPLMYLIQMEHQFLVNEKAERCLFMASKWDENDACLEEKRFWYEPNLELRAGIIAAWEQFERDLAAYAPPVIAEMPKAEVKIELPALFVHAKGEITTHNMEEFGQALTEKLAEVRAIALVTDQDFSNAKDAAKKFRETAKSIALSKEQMLAQTETIGEAARKMDAWAKDLNATALQLEKDVEREDKVKKEAMILEAKQAYSEHIAALEAEIKPIRLTVVAPDFAGAIKGKRNYASMHDAIQTALALEGKQKADEQAKDIRVKLAWCKENFDGHGFLFADMQQIIFKPLDDLQMLVKSRINAHKAQEEARMEAARERIRQEEEIKAKAKIEAEAREKAEAELQQWVNDEHAKIQNTGHHENVKKEPDANIDVTADVDHDTKDSPKLLSKDSLLKEIVGALNYLSVSELIKTIEFIKSLKKRAA